MLRLSALAVAVCTILLATPALAAQDLPPGGTFIDDDGSVHEGNIEAIARAGITRGCNPPTSDRYCPNDTVTRGQMAAFLVRGLKLTDIDPGITFTDITASTFEDDILKLATAGITKGCNPPTSDRYCPNDTVTRGQMAAFLVRGLKLTDIDPGITFTDIAASIFEDDILKLATAGITKGCNPPANDRYCPNDTVTRAQMASFLARGLGLVEMRPPPMPAPGTMTVQLEVDGTTRRYTLHIPRRTSRLLPLVLDLHGFGGTPEGQERNSRFSVKGGSEGFVVAQPAATGSIPRWNISSGSGSQRDVAFLRAVVEDIARELPIDRQAVFAAGFSNGGGMVHRLACEASDLVAAIGVVAGQQVVVDACTPPDSVAVSALHGTSDDIVPFTGDGLLFPPIPQWIQGWADRNSCTGPPQSSQPVPDVDRTVWDGCTDGATVELRTIDGGEHRWPTMPGDPISATDTLWDFFSAQPRK